MQYKMRIASCVTDLGNNVSRHFSPSAMGRCSTTACDEVPSAHNIIISVNRDVNYHAGLTEGRVALVFLCATTKVSLNSVHDVESAGTMRTFRSFDGTSATVHVHPMYSGLSVERSTA